MTAKDTLVKDGISQPTRDGFGRGLLQLGDVKKVVALTADLSESTRCHWFAEKYPERFIQVGVSEQNMMGVASGLALNGKIPFITSYAVFSPGRSWDQLRVSVCYTRANVKVVGAHAGISVGPDGATHQALEDIAIVRVLPNIIVVVPCDAVEAQKATLAIAGHEGPSYLRVGREKTPVITTEDTPFKIGEAEVFRDGKDVAIIACGSMVAEALAAAEALAKEGIDALVINNHTIKPLDSKKILAAARGCGCVVTAEEHQIAGGLGSAVLELLSSEAIPLERVGVRDSFGESGTPAELMKKYGLTRQDIAAAARRILAVKRGTAKCPAPEAFCFFDGKTARTLDELRHNLLVISLATFNHHVKGDRNDFAAWVADVFGELDLSKAILKAKSRAGILRVLNSYMVKRL